MGATFFAKPADLGKGLEKNHETEKELIVGYWKIATGKPSMTWEQSVDEALCYGWIDGIRRGIDAESYSVRFTPRKATSSWRAVNIRKIGELTAAGRMKPAGIAAWEKRKDSKSAIYSYEKAPSELSAEFEKKFRSDKKAWAFFSAQPAGYRKTAIHLVMAAKQERTRESRMEALISDSAAGLRLKQLRR